jgi:putative endonuclease
LLARLTETTIRLLDLFQPRAREGDSWPEHQRTRRRGEEYAYFYLRKLGYVLVARNYRSSRRRGEIDLIGWDKDVLCFIEVKTRQSHAVKPAEAAVDRDKRRELAAVAREYLRHIPAEPEWRFDVVSVYYDRSSTRPAVELFKNAFGIS